ncbi:MAG: DsrE family protein [Phycisphaerales bacterium]|nr:MAG: DsrE family protein [Phycisphaerales bacterium]
MKTRTHLIALAMVLLVGVMVGQTWVKADDSGERDKVAVVWTSGDSEVAHKMCLMYTHAAKNAKWFDDVTLIIWGPSSRLLAGDKELQAKIKSMMDSGVVVQACIVCADMYGVSDDLRAMGIEVKGMGKPLSDLLKTDWKVLTF